MIFKTKIQATSTGAEIIAACREGMSWIGEQGYAYPDVYVCVNLLSEEITSTMYGKIADHDITVRMNASGSDFEVLFKNMEEIMLAKFVDHSEIVRRKFYEQFSKLIDDAPTEVDPAIADGLKKIFRSIHDPLIEDMRNHISSNEEIDVVTN